MDLNKNILLFKMEKDRIYLLVPFDLKDELKKTEKILWDTKKRLWYCLKITETLKPYVAFFVDVEYDEKDEMKEKYKSLRWNRTFKSSLVVEEDFEKMKKDAK